MKKAVAKAMASVAFMTMAGFGVAACGTDPGYVDNGYEQVWDHGHYTYVPYDYYQSHRSYYSNSAHPAHHRSSSYITSHHVTVMHKTTTTVHSNGSRTTTHSRTTTRRSTTTRKSSGFSSGSRSYRKR